MKTSWLLPEYISDVLPDQARVLEALRRTILDIYDRHGYELVLPPMLEYVESLLVGSGSDLDLKTFKLVDQLSGRTMGLRADITPQVARMDAHLLNREGVVRLCYCGCIVHTLPADVSATRELLQIGAEIYGHAGIESDIEILQLMLHSIVICRLDGVYINVGHGKIFRALVAFCQLSDHVEAAVFDALQCKDFPAVHALAATLSEHQAQFIRALCDLSGGREVLERVARLLPEDVEVSHALADLAQVVAVLDDLGVAWGIDLADLCGYHYHTGVVFTAYAGGFPNAIARGGRYDAIGNAFGRSRPATGFSMDLRKISEYLCQKTAAAPGRLVYAPYALADSAMHVYVAHLRAQGVRVVSGLPGHTEEPISLGCDAILKNIQGQWSIQPL